ncbi:MAG: hypothetical protein NTV49_04365 [Kiritimatiellaeota bacterium]|nr:hypothetical protein [Kiritimatiellota bacterium]
MKATIRCWRLAVLLAALLVGLSAGGVGRAAGAVVSEAEALLQSVFRMRLVDQLPGQIQPLLDGLGTGDVTQVKTAYDLRSEGEISATRNELQARFGAASRARYEGFAAALEGAENNKDADFLRQLATTLALEPPPRNYDELHSQCMSLKLAGSLHSASGFLSNLQTWLLLKQRVPNMPPLDAWLTRDQKTATTAPAAPVAAPPPPRRSAAMQLAAAEPALPEYKEEEGQTNDLLASFSSSLKERREATRQQAEKGMQTVTSERERAEQELATRKQAEATGEAEAIKNQAQKLADAETQAIEQRANTWESKLKTVVSSTVGAASGAFFGGLGTQAGEKLTKELFKNDATSE